MDISLNSVKNVCCYAVDVLGIQTSKLCSILYRSCLCMICSQFRVKGDCHVETCSRDITLHLYIIMVPLLVS